MVVVIVPDLVMVLPVSVMPADPFVLYAPVNVRFEVVDPLIVMEAALTSRVLMVVVFVIETAPRRVVAPADPERVIAPVPEVRVKSAAPSTVLEKVIVPLLALVSIVLPAIVVGIEDEKLFAVMLDPMEREAPEGTVTSPSGVIALPRAPVKVSAPPPFKSMFC